MCETALQNKVVFFLYENQKTVGNFLKNVEKIKRMGYSDNAKVV
jgi:hypothetical protein